jgi:hypothetical protein
MQQKFTAKKLVVTFTLPTGIAGRPAHNVVRLRIPARVGPLSGRIKELLNSPRIPAKATILKTEVA